MAPSTRTFTAGAVLILLTIILGSAVLFLAWPTWLTGGACEFTVERFDFNDLTGEIQGYCHEVLPYRSELEWVFPPGTGEDHPYRVFWDQYSPRFLRWPSRPIPGQMIFPLATPEETKKEWELKTYDSYHQRWLLAPGTYRLRVGEDLVYYRRTEPSGNVVEARIRVRSH